MATEQDMQSEAFGEVRGMLAQREKDFAWQGEMLRILDQASREPEPYRDLMLPYLKGPLSFEQCDVVFKTSSAEGLRQLARLLPETSAVGVNLHCRESDDAAKSLSELGDLTRRVTHLNVHGDSYFRAKGFRELFAEALWPRLEALHLRLIRSDAMDFSVMGARRPRELALEQIVMNPKLIAAMDESEVFSELRVLSLNTTTIKTKELDVFLGAGFMQALEVLHDIRTLGDKGVVALATSPVLGTMRELSLFDERLSDKAFAALMSSPHGAALRTLKWWSTRPLGAKGIAALCERAPGLEALELTEGGGGFDEKALKRLASASGLSGLKEFKAWVRVEEAQAVKLLSQGSWFAGLRSYQLKQR